MDNNIQRNLGQLFLRSGYNLHIKMIKEQMVDVVTIQFSSSCFSFLFSARWGGVYLKKYTKNFCYSIYKLCHLSSPQFTFYICLYIYKFDILGCKQLRYQKMVYCNRNVTLSPVNFLIVFINKLILHKFHLSSYGQHATIIFKHLLSCLPYFHCLYLFYFFFMFINILRFQININ